MNNIRLRLLDLSSVSGIGRTKMYSSFKLENVLSINIDSYSKILFQMFTDFFSKN